MVMMKKHDLYGEIDQLETFRMILPILRLKMRY